MEPESPSPYPQVPATCPYPEPTPSSPHDPLQLPEDMHVLQTLFYLTIALHVSGISITHLQERKTTVNTATGKRYTVLLSVAIVEELELI